MYSDAVNLEPHAFTLRIVPSRLPNLGDEFPIQARSPCTLLDVAGISRGNEQVTVDCASLLHTSPSPVARLFFFFPRLCALRVTRLGERASRPMR